MARPDKYDTHVKPYLNDIHKMCLDMTEEQIAKTLGVSRSAWKRYKKLHSPLMSALKRGRQELVCELRSSLIKRARGFVFTETRITKEYGKITKEEKITKYYPPDVAALNLALKNYDPDHWANDPQMLKIREKELELQERKLEQNEW